MCVCVCQRERKTFGRVGGPGREPGTGKGRQRLVVAEERDLEATHTHESTQSPSLVIGLAGRL